MHGRQSFIRHITLTSVVVRDLNLIRIAISPHKADAPLVIDADAVLTCTIGRKLFKSSL
jgi:hypothetical protein